ncbi:NUDIX hydrolase [Motiliproteus sp. SC1-56]|uniref:NUDIX domain-containing protein n=1 Tax=Motiliproteus sp. SC1-56 TaxID=2799565 RepID=UPI001A8C0F55|nr:NUDIX hydrolase [Motiliproteus sp. SC1-56]
MSDQNPWTTLATRWVYDNPWIAVREDRVLNPGGGEGVYGVVRFKNRAVGVIPVDDAGHTWLVGQYRYALGHYSWEIPMGGHPVEEPEEDGALRELREETGLRAGRLDTLLEVDLSNSVTDERGVVYLARELTPGPTDFDETEAIELRRLPFDEALAMALDGRIRDTLSVAGLCALGLRRQTFGL